MKRWRFIAPLALFVVLLGFLAAGLNLNPREVPSPLIGKPAPAFALPRLDDPYAASLSDTSGRVGIDFGVYGAPETFIIDKAGGIRFKHIGTLTAQVLREHIEPLLKRLELDA